MAWFKTDDQLPNHRKARAVRRSHPSKRRDVAPFGLWVLAGAISTDGWVPLEILEDWDDDAARLAERLVAAGLWHPTVRDGEPGYVFHDWHDQNPARDDTNPSATGTFGNHVRWHVQRKLVMPDCHHCPNESADDRPESTRRSADEGYPLEVSEESLNGESADDLQRLRASRDLVGNEASAESPRSSADDLRKREHGGYPDSSAESLPSRPDPTRTRPEPDQTTPSRKRSEPERFDEFWDAYDKKVGRKKAEQKYALALRKPGITEDLLIAAAASYVDWQRREGKHPQFTKDPTTWLNGEHWTDERVARAQPMTRVQEHLTLVQQLAAEEAGQPTIPQIGHRR